MTLIQRLDGTTYDLLDYGIRTRDVLISAPTPEHEFQKVEGMNGVIDYGTTYGSRDIKCLYRATSHDFKDFSLLRDEIFNFFRTEESFYLIEKRLPGKRWLVKVSNSYQIPQRNVYGNFDIDFIGIKGVSESIGTTADIDNPELINLHPSSWMQGYWVNIIGNNNTAILSTTVRTIQRIETRGNVEYVAKNQSNEADLIISMYNTNGYKRRVVIAPGEELTFTTDADIIKVGIHFSTVSTTGVDISASDIGGSLKATLKKKTGGINSDDELWGFGMGLIADDDSLIYTHIGTSFKIFNAGNVAVHPFEQDIIISISDVVGSDDYLQLENMTTGDKFRVNEQVKKSKFIKLDGPNITSNGLQFLRSTNKQYITLAPGWNDFKITGATSAKVSFDFRFYYL